MRLCTWRRATSNGPSSTTTADLCIVPIDDERTVLARIIPANPLAPGSTLPRTDSPQDLILYSGSLSPDPATPHPFNWLAPGREALDTLCGSLRSRREVAGTICFQPHARHILNDVPSALRFLHDHAGEPFGIALNPALLIERTMLETLQDHLTRILQGLGPHVRYVILADPDPMNRWAVAPSRSPEDLPRDLIHSLIEEHVAEGVPVVIAPRTAETPLNRSGKPAAL